MTSAGVLTIELPLPPRELSSNARIHWRTRAQFTAYYRQTAYAETRNASHYPYIHQPVRVSYAFGTKGSRKYGLYAPQDETNAVDSIKAAQDGIAQALGFDDRHMRLGPVTIDKKCGPWVRVTIEALE